MTKRGKKVQLETFGKDERESSSRTGTSAKTRKETVSKGSEENVQGTRKACETDERKEFGRCSNPLDHQGEPINETELNRRVTRNKIQDQNENPYGKSFRLLRQEVRARRYFSLTPRAHFKQTGAILNEMN